jgi:hypothetical protein
MTDPNDAAVAAVALIVEHLGVDAEDAEFIRAVIEQAVAYALADVCVGRAPEPSEN